MILVFRFIKIVNQNYDIWFWPERLMLFYAFLWCSIHLSAIVCHSSIYRFWLPLWHHQTFLEQSQLIVRLSIFFWPLYCLFFDLEMILITSLIAANFSWTCLDMSGLGWTLQTAWTIYGMFSAKKQLFIKRNKDIKSEGTNI